MKWAASRWGRASSRDSIFLGLYLLHPMFDFRWFLCCLNACVESFLTNPILLGEIAKSHIRDFDPYGGLWIRCCFGYLSLWIKPIYHNNLGVWKVHWILRPQGTISGFGTFLSNIKRNSWNLTDHYSFVQHLFDLIFVEWVWLWSLVLKWVIQKEIFANFSTL